jgi:hypothetical protein
MRSIALTYTPYLGKVMAVFAVTIALSLFLYGFFLLEAVAHAASLTDTTRSIHARTSEVSKLEEHYLEATKGITLERAKGLGFVAPAAVSTIFANATTRSLSVRGN